jgi:hypothetical protein
VHPLTVIGRFCSRNTIIVAIAASPSTTYCSLTRDTHRGRGDDSESEGGYTGKETKTMVQEGSYTGKETKTMVKSWV